MSDYYSEWTAVWSDYLIPGEYVKWTGQPARRIRFQPIYLFIIPFTFVWCGGVIGAAAASVMNYIEGEGGIVEILFNLPFFAGGAFFIYVLYILPLMRRRQTRYAVTNMRVMEYFRGKINTVSIEPHTPVMISAVSKRGTASVTVGAPYDDPREQAKRPGELVRDMSNLTPGIITMMDIPEAERVYRLIMHRDEG